MTGSTDAWVFARALLGKIVTRLSDSTCESTGSSQAGSSSVEWAERLLAGNAALRPVGHLQSQQSECNSGQKFGRDVNGTLIEWEEADHPRAPKGTSTGGQWVKKGGEGGVTSTSKSRSFLDAITQRNQTISGLTGVVTPGMVQAGRISSELSSAAKLPGEVARAAAGGLGTGGKAVANGLATAVKDVATLGLLPGQLELIGVTDEDRERGYDTAVSIATASGQVLIAVGTGGIASALSKGGSVARAASGALLAYDSAGNAVGVVQGLYDASENGVTLANGAQVAGSALGLGANAKAAQGLRQAAAVRRAAEVDEYVKSLPKKTTPTSSPASQYEIMHTGPHNYSVSGNGVTFDIDGYDVTTILEAKHVGRPKSSPYVPSSSCPDFVRDEIIGDVRHQLAKARAIIDSKSTPFKEITIITNHPESKELFESLLREMSIPGHVVIKQ